MHAAQAQCMRNACATHVQCVWQVVRGNSIVMMEALEKLWSEVRHSAPLIAPCSCVCEP